MFLQISGKKYSLPAIFSKHVFNRASETEELKKNKSTEDLQLNELNKNGEERVTRR